MEMSESKSATEQVCTYLTLVIVQLILLPEILLLKKSSMFYTSRLLSIRKLVVDNGVFIELNPYYFLIKDPCRRKRSCVAGVEQASTRSSLQKISALKCAMFSSRVSKEQ
jgi:hypothetical protein